MRFIVLINLLMMLIPTIGLTETTNNLVSQDFTTGWSGTNVDTTHGSGTIAGVNGEYVESDSVSLSTDLDLNKPTINNGFTITGSSNIWFWNSYTQSVTQTIKTTDDNGEVITQNRIINGNSNATYFTNYSDTLIISSNTQSDYEISLRYNFSVPGTTGHYGADLKDPSLTVEYTFKEELNSTVEQEIIDLFEDFKIENDIKFEDTKFEDNFVALPEPDFAIEEEFSMGEPEFKEEPSFEEPMFMDMPEEQKQEEPEMEIMTQLFVEEKEEKEDIDNSSDEGIIEVVEEESTEEEETTSELLQEGFNEEQKDNEQEESDSEITETANASEKSSTKQKSVQSKETKTANAKSQSSNLELEKVMDKIDEKVKDVGKNLALKNIVKLKAMSNNDILLSTYNVPFYKPKDIYLDQIDIADDRDIYSNINLNKYVANDPIAIRANKINELEIERQQLLIQLEVLKNEL